MPLPDPPPPTRTRLAHLARAEALLHLAGDAHMAGPAIERYLAVFRAAMNANGATTLYSNLHVGYDWCGAFVYYCCLQAGFRFPPKPVPAYRWTLAAVPAWQHWASREGFYHPIAAASPQPGDIALYNHLYDDHPLDHIGIVVDVLADGILSAEGNNANRTGLFPRPTSVIAGLVRLPTQRPL